MREGLTMGKLGKAMPFIRLVINLVTALLEAVDRGDDETVASILDGELATTTAMKLAEADARARFPDEGGQ